MVSNLSKAVDAATMAASTYTDANTQPATQPDTPQTDNTRPGRMSQPGHSGEELTHHSLEFQMHDGLIDGYTRYKVVARFNCYNIESCMQKGLHWTTDNIVRSYSSMLSDTDPADRGNTAFKHGRVWYIREFPNRHWTKSSWTGKVYLYANSIQLLADFRLERLRRNQIFWAKASSSFDKCVFRYSTYDTSLNINCIFEKDRFDIWWLWPMDSLESKGGLMRRVFSTAGRMLVEIVVIALVLMIFTSSIDADMSLNRGTEAGALV